MDPGDQYPLAPYNECFWFQNQSGSFVPRVCLCARVCVCVCVREGTSLPFYLDAFLLSNLIFFCIVVILLHVAKCNSSVKVYPQYPLPLLRSLANSSILQSQNLLRVGLPVLLVCSWFFYSSFTCASLCTMSLLKAEVTHLCVSSVVPGT